MYDVLLRGAKVVDGTGGPARAADVGVIGDRIVEVGRLKGPAIEEVNLSGLVLAPGFIDLHTHYDGQVLWDPDLTPSSWYGVTTVVIGNCGFGIAPAGPSHRDNILRTLERVEDMAMESLVAGIDWTFETFPEYLDTLRALPLTINVGVYVGHTPLRYYAMGDDAHIRTAQVDELAQMVEGVKTAMASGAMGFATSVARGHMGAYGNPVPSRLAAEEEIFELVGALGQAGRGVVHFAGPGNGFHFREIGQLAERSGRPVTWAALLVDSDRPGHAVDVLRRLSEVSEEVRPQVSCRPAVVQLTLLNPTPLAALPAFRETVGMPLAELLRLYGDDEWNARAREALDDKWGNGWHRVSVSESEVHGEFVGMTLEELGRDQGRSAAEIFLELARSEELETRFTVTFANDNEEELGQLLQDRRTILGLSDAGAHVSQLCDACFAPFLLQHWVRERGTLTLEEAVWRLSGDPAAFLGLERRGVIKAGYFADLVAFDPATVGVTPLERIYDLPGGADRVVSRPVGVEHVWVNGSQIRRNGEQLGSPGSGVVVTPRKG